MASSLRQLVAPGYLFACLTLGGSAQGASANALLQLVGLAIIAWAAVAAGQEPLRRPARQLLWLLIAGLIVVAIQLVPLPAALWLNAGGRQAFAEGYRLLGLAVPARPLSLAPHDSLATLLALIPPIALFCAIVRLKAYRAGWLVLALIAAAFAGIVLGALQVSSPDARASPWYPYPQSSFGMASGFFANVNNMAMLLLCCLPFLAAIFVSTRGKGTQRYSAAFALCVAAAVVLIIGIAFNGSLAGYGLLVPVVVASMLLIVRPKRSLRSGLAMASAFMLLAAIGALAFSPLGDRALGSWTSVQSRAAMVASTTKATRDFLPFGSGLGTFREVYQLYEDRDQVGHVRVNHAHNDYLELALELGVPGILLIAAFLLWWFRVAWRSWQFAEAGPYARAASIASAVLLAHSLVEFPLRTAALSGAFAMCLALMVERRGPREPERADLRPTRHLELR